MSDKGPVAPRGWKRGPDGQAFRQKNDGSWWWQASDQRWYPEAQHPTYRPAPPPPPPPPMAPEATPPPIAPSAPPAETQLMPSAPAPSGRSTAITERAPAAPLPRRAWTAFRRWPKGIQIALWIFLVVVVIASLAPKDEPAQNLDAGSTTTSPVRTTTGLVLSKAVTTTSPAPLGVVGTTPPATAAPATGPPETDPPETSPPETDPPVTDPPVTDPPATDPPATDPPVYYANCTEVREAGAAPIHRGEPGYRPGLDGDDDGIACETTG